MRSFLSKTAAILLSVSFALAWNPTTAEAVKKRPPTLTVEWDLQATDDQGRRTQCQGDEEQYAIKGVHQGTLLTACAILSRHHHVAATAQQS